MQMRRMNSARVGAIVAAAIGGLAFGVAFAYGFMFLLANTSLWFARIHPPVQTEDFLGSMGQSIYYLCVTAGLGIGFFALVRRSMPVAVRVFLVCSALPLLGIMALCSGFSIDALTTTRYQ